MSSFNNANPISFIAPHISVKQDMNNQQNSNSRSSSGHYNNNNNNSYNNYDTSNTISSNNNSLNNVEGYTPNESSTCSDATILHSEPKLQHDDGTCVDFHTLIDEIAEELSTDKQVVKELSFILFNKPQRSEIEHLDIKGLLNFMREKAIISENNTDMLEQYLNSIGNTTIVEKILDFKKQPSDTTPAIRDPVKHEQKRTVPNIASTTYTTNAYGDKQQSFNSHSSTFNQQQQPQHYQMGPNEYYPSNSPSFNQPNYLPHNSYTYSSYNPNNNNNNNNNNKNNNGQINSYGNLNRSYGPSTNNNYYTSNNGVERLSQTLNSISIQELNVKSIYPTPEILEMRTNKSTLASYEIFKYPMHDVDKTHGVCLIINNVTFNSPHLLKRVGSDVDVANLNRVFTKLNYKVDIQKDLTADEMEVVAKRYSNEVKHTDYDSFVCCILTHGSNDGILYGTDGKEIKLNHILQMFHSSQCQSLSGKPKIFILQACRGDKEDLGHGIASDADLEIMEISQKQTTYLPDMSDFLVAYTTPPGYVSWRSKSEGTWYITELCDLLATKHKNYDLMTILTQVNNKVASRKTNLGYKQIPAPLTYLRGLLYIL